tara:strand:+ start:902 stop:1084 length:183 start_codon:yes stop_codon:yes gene_type:complete
MKAKKEEDHYYNEYGERVSFNDSLKPYLEKARKRQQEEDSWNRFVREQDEKEKKRKRNKK